MFQKDFVQQASADFGDKLWDNFRTCGFSRAILIGPRTDVISKQSVDAKFDAAHVTIWSVDKIRATKIASCGHLARAAGVHSCSYTVVKIAMSGPAVHSNQRQS